MKFRKDLKFDENKITKFKLDSDFCGRLPALPDDDFLGLQRDILRNDLRDKLVVWKEKNVLVDGYHRLWICLQNKIPYENKIHYQSFPTRNAAILWMLYNQLHRRGGLTLYMRILLAIDAEPALIDEGKRIQKEQAERGKEGGRGKEKQKPLRPQEAEGFDTRKELCKLAGGCSHKVIDSVRFTEDKRKEGYWSEITEVLDKELKRGIAHSVSVNGDEYQVSIANLHRQIKNMVDIDEAVKESILTEDVQKIQVVEDRIAFLRAVESVGKEATLEIQEEVLEKCNKDKDFGTFAIGVLLGEVIKQKEEEPEEEPEEESEGEKKDGEEERLKKELEEKTGDVKDRIKGVEKTMRKLTISFDKDCESVKLLNLDLMTSYKSIEDYKKLVEDCQLDEKTVEIDATLKFEFQRASFRLVSYLRDTFEGKMKEEKTELLPEGKI